MKEKELKPIDTNVIIQQDRRIRLPILLSSYIDLELGKTNFDIFVNGDEIILKKSKDNKVNNYANRQKGEK